MNRLAARKASEVAAARRARVAAHEAAVTAAVALFFDRTGRAGTVRAEARVRAERIIVEAETVAGGLEAEADQAVARLRVLGEPVVEIATMTDQPVSNIRAALARAARTPKPGLITDPDAEGSPPPASAAMTTDSLEPAKDLPRTGTSHRAGGAVEQGSDLPRSAA